MRTERRLPTGRLLTLAALLAACPYAVAADVEFDPSVDVNVFYDGNTRGVGDPDDPNQFAEEPSAFVGGIGVSLPWSVRTPATTFSLSYSPRREIYGDEERPDFTSHAFFSSLARTVSARASYTLTADYNRSDRQELDPRRPPEEQGITRTYVARRTFDSGGVGASGSFSAGRRSSLNWRLGARFNHGEDLEGSAFDDSESYDGLFGWAMNYSAQGSAGIAVLAQHFDYETRESVDVLSIGHTGTRRFSREGSLSYAVGVLRSDDGNDTSFSGSALLNASWTTGPNSSIAAGLRQGASAGDGISGATLDRGGYVSWSYASPRGFNVDLAGAYWDRDALNDAQGGEAPPSAFTFSDSFSWRLGRFFRLGLFHTYHDQDVPEGGDPGLATRYHSAGLYVSWRIRGERREGA